MDRPAAFRAVGQANGANPLPIFFPCHRVVASNGLGGYGGGRGEASPAGVGGVVRRRHLESATRSPWHTRAVETSETLQQTFDLSGRVAVVTGAGSGIGRATAQVLAAAGAVVYCADVREAEALETAAEIIVAGGSAVGHSVDVAEADEVGALVQAAVADHGRVDVMCNIAGMMLDGSILELSGDDLDRIVAVNLKGVLYGCQAAGRVMVEQGSGSIVNMSSAAALTPPAPHIGAYAITKAAVLQLTRTMAVEVGRKGVRVNAVAPGFVPTGMTARYYRRPDGTIDEDLRDQVLAPMRKFAPLGRVGSPEDIAYCVLYLASDASSFLTGQCLSPNGGVASCARPAVGIAPSRP